MATINRNSRIQVLYSNTSGVTPDNEQLYNGEFAWAYGDDGAGGGDVKELYIGGGDSADVTFVGAEILRHSDDPFNEEPPPSEDNKLATTRAIYKFVDGQLGQKAGVVTIAGAAGNVTVGGTGGITIDNDPSLNGGFTVGIEDGGIDTVQLADNAVTTNKINNASVTNNKLFNPYISISTNSSLPQNINLGNNLNFDNTTNITASKASSTITFSLNNDVDITGSLTADTAIHTTDLYVANGIANSELQNSGVTIVAGAGLTSDTEAVDLGGTLTLNILAASAGGLTVNADTIALKNSGGLSNNHFLLWDDSNSQLKDSPIVVNGSSIDLDTGYDLSVGGTLEVDGNLIVQGSLTTLDVTRVEVEDPIIFIGATSGTPSARDIGFIAKVQNGEYSGLIRDDTEDVYYLFDTANDYSDTTSFNPDNVNVKELRAHIVAGTFTSS